MTDETSPDASWLIHREALASLYRELDHEIAAHGPSCQLSGRCCRFREYGHTLFLSELEARYLVAEAPPPPGPLDDGQTCPWQDHHGRCTAHAARPLGCRVYFCEPAFAEHSRALSETHIARLKHLADELGSDWNYAPLHWHLEHASSRGGLALRRAVRVESSSSTPTIPPAWSLPIARQEEP